MSQTKVVYLMDVFPDAKFFRRNVPRYGMGQYAPGQQADGYGRKISTDYMVKIGTRSHRVYAICFSNAASHYILKGGESYNVRDFDIPEDVLRG